MGMDARVLRRCPGAGSSRPRGRFGWAGAALAVVLVVALALRLQSVTSGLPYAFISPDEATVVPKAVEVAGGQLNPMFFYYPSLFFYVLAAVYWLVSPFWALLHGELLVRPGALAVDAGALYLVGRLVVVAFGVAAVGLVYRLGRAAYGAAAGLLAAAFLAVTPLHVEYSHLAVTDVPAVTLGLLGLFLLHGAAQGRGLGRLTAGAVAVGLAASTKYNLGMLVLPATVAALYAGRPAVAAAVAAGRPALPAWARLLAVRLCLPLAFAFVLASPFIVLDLPRFLAEFSRQHAIVQRGWLGFEHVDNGYWYNLSVNLADALGLVLLGLAVAGLVWALWRRAPLDLMLAPTIVVYFAYVSSWSELADRYMLPIVPLLLLLAARLCVVLWEVRPAWRRALLPGAAALAALAVALPLADSVARNRDLAEPDVRERAKAWVERTIEPGTRIATETSGPPLVARSDLPSYRAEGLRPAYYRLRRLELPLPGEPHTQRSMRWLRDHRVEYVILSSAVYGRVLAAPDEYPGLVAFYAALERRGDLVRVFTPRPGERGPVIKVYRLDGSSRT
jgi:4-amino-4-deoxy-L-arabinose transferase-like glycosyltransferase